MAEMDLLQLQAFADKLAGVVLDQVEADKVLDREKIASAMMGHIVKFGLEQRKAHVAELQKALEGVEMAPDMGRVIYGDQPPRLAPVRSGSPAYVITGRPSNGNPVHVICRCDECLRRHHSEAAAIEQRRSAWNGGAEWLQKQAERKGFRAAHLQDVKTVTVRLYRLDENGQRQPVAVTDDLILALRGAIEDDSPHELICSDQVVFPDGRVMTGLDIARAGIGLNPAQIWAQMRRNRNPRP